MSSRHLPGDPTMDELIASFAADEEWRDAEYAQGQCDDAAAGFVGHCEQRGVAARVCYWDPHSNEPAADDDDWVEHTVAVCRIGESCWMVDWTASQFGSDRFPVVELRADVLI